MKRTLILGGGFGGVATAHALRRLRPDDEIVVVDRATHFMVGFRKTWALLGKGPLDAGRGALADLEKSDIAFRRGTVTAIDPAGRRAQVDGEWLEADALVVALGARLATEEIPGLQAHGLNLYEPAAIPEVRKALHDFSGGHVAVGVFGLPYKCPPAPYEIAIMTREFYRERGVPVTVEVFTPLPLSLPIVGEAGCGIIDRRLADHDVTFLPAHTATAVEEAEVVFADERRPFDLLLGVPPHRCPPVVVESGLAEEDGWVQVNARTLETDFDGVYAIGDVTSVPMANGKPLPKAGVFAEGQGQVVAQRIAATFGGRPPQSTFEGRGGCFLEVGSGEAMMVQGHFLAESGPDVTLDGPSADYVREKEAFERERLQQWFSAG